MARAWKFAGNVCLVILALLLELVVLDVGGELIFGRSHGPMADTRFRRKERLAAWHAYAENPSPEANAAFQEEMHLMRQHPNPEWIGLPILFVAVNGMAIYYFFRRRRMTQLV